MEKGQRQGRMPMEGNWDRDSRQEGVWIWEHHLMCNTCGSIQIRLGNSGTQAGKVGTFCRD